MMTAARVTIPAAILLGVLSLSSGAAPGQAAGLTTSAAAAATRAQISAGPDRAVVDDRAEVSHVEPYLAAHPADPDHLVGISTLFLRDGWRNVVVTSRDGGVSWSSVDLVGCEGDPWVDFGTGDRVFASCLLADPDGGDGITTALLRSADGGRTWSEPVAMPYGRGGSTDHPTLIVDRASSTVYVTQGQWLAVPDRRGRFYVPSLSRSVDGGGSLQEPVFLAHDNLHQQPLDGGLLADGTVAVLFQDYMVNNRLLEHRRTWMTISTDGGRTLEAPTLVHEQVDRAMPWAMAVDPSPARRDRIYVAIDGDWSRPGGRSGSSEEIVSEILVIHSDDRGESWSAPVPASDTTPGVERGIPAIAVSRDGTVGVAWYDRRRDPRGGCFDVFFAASVDGGDTYLPDVRLTEEPSCPGAGPAPGVARRFPLGGDYSGLAAAADGSFHVLWADARTGTYQLRTSRVEVTAE